MKCSQIDLADTEIACYDHKMVGQRMDQPRREKSHRFPGVQSVANVRAFVHSFITDASCEMNCLICWSINCPFSSSDCRDRTYAIEVPSDHWAVSESAALIEPLSELLADPDATVRSADGRPARGRAFNQGAVPYLAGCSHRNGDEPGEAAGSPGCKPIDQVLGRRARAFALKQAGCVGSWL